MIEPTGEELPIAFVGSYVPRRCGIATFTRDMATFTAGAGATSMVVAVTDPSGEYEYPPEVKYEIRQGVKADYARAGEYVSYSGAKLVSIQHEFGIFGGDDGAYVLELLAALRVPAVATLHTVLRDPSESQRQIIRQICNRSASVVVMSRIARDLLRSSHGVSGDKVHIIPHGIPVLAARDQQALKRKFGVGGKAVLLTFGLLGPSKGIETVIRALPSLVREFPDLVYFVVGATHPAIVRRHGEAYRTSLEQEAERLGVREHIVFRDQFIAADELASYLQAADIFVTPYLNEAQVTSGVLSYAMGAGAAVVSTPYWHAQELLADGRGRLFPFRDHGALVRELSALLGSRAELDRTRAACFEFTRSMVWPTVGEAYRGLFQRMVGQHRPEPPISPSPRVSSLPDLRLDHLQRMTDDTGMIQHATYSVPARRSGYCVDDNARALIVALHADRVQPSGATRRLVTTFLSYLLCSQDADGHFSNFMRYDRTFEGGARSDDCLGRAVWALGTATRLSADDGARWVAREMLSRALPRTSELGPRGTSLAILGLSEQLVAAPDAVDARTQLGLLAEKLVALYQRERTDSWRWFERTLTYDNAIFPLALFTAYRVTKERASLRVAREALEFLETECFEGDRLALVGSRGWHPRGEVKATADEQPIDALAFVLAFRGAHLATGDPHYLARMRSSFDWFVGQNRLGASLYDSATAGCRDGLGVEEVNQNQGAESTVSFLLALLTMLDLGGEGLEIAEASPAEEGPVSCR